MRFLIDLAPLIVFFIAFKWFGIQVATAVLMLGLVLQIAYLKIRYGTVAQMYWISLCFVLVFGGLSLWLGDPRFLQWKVTVINWILAAVLGWSPLLFKKNLIRALFHTQMTLNEIIWTRLNYFWTGYFLGLGALNLLIMYYCSLETWVEFKAFGILGLTFLFSCFQASYIYFKMREKPSQ